MEPSEISVQELVDSAELSHLTRQELVGLLSVEEGGRHVNHHPR